MSQQLKRSQKTIDFSNSTATPAAPMYVTRERSFIKPNRDATKRRSQTMATIKAGGGGGGKPTLEIYRPPNVRTDLPKLNVHAKEFTMNHHDMIHPSKSSGHLNFGLVNHQYHPLQHSKSSGNVLRHPGLIPIIPAAALQIPIASQTQLFNQLRPYELLNHAVFSGQNQPNNLKRSKSLGAADSQNLAAKLKSISKEDLDLKIFSVEEQANLKQALDDSSQLTSRTLMDLVKTVMEKAVEGIRHCEAIAKLCVALIEAGDHNQTFLESLLNMCQQWYQERDKILRGIKAGDGTRFTAFMWFLTELCSQMKRHQMKEQFEQLQPELVLLSVLAKCCQACVSLPIKCLSETECLFFVLTSIGRDLEAELPQQLEQLLASVRDGFLASAGSSAVRRTLLQLIELHASNWQLPGSSVLYYYPRIK